EREQEHADEHQVSPLELFFDLVFVFAITQVTSLLAHDPTWGGVLRGMLVLAAVWWAWTGIRLVDEREGCRRGWRPAGDACCDGGHARRRLGGAGRVRRRRRAVGAAYLLVRVLHLVLSAIVGRDDPDRRSALLRFAPTATLGASLLLLAGFLEGHERIAVWVGALAIDYL